MDVDAIDDFDFEIETTPFQSYVMAAVANQLTDASPQAEQPAHITIPLRPHQLTLLAAARNLEAKASITQINLNEDILHTDYGVLADRVGSGKSLVALALVRDSSIQRSKFIWKESGCARILSIRQVQQPTQDIPIPEIGKPFFANTSLMIVPHNVATQWETYVKTQTTLGNTTIFIRKVRDCHIPNFMQTLFSAELVVISCTMVKKFRDILRADHMIYFSNIVWSRLFLDEADTLTLTLRLGGVRARFIWCITGSWLNMLFPNGLYPHAISNEPEYIRTILGNGGISGIASNTNILRQILPSQLIAQFTQLILRNSEAWINTSIARPRIYHEYIQCKAPPNIHILRGFISPSAMEALHAGDTAGALSVLGLTPVSLSSVADRVTESLRGELVQAEKLLEFKRTMDYSTAIAKAHALEKAEAKVARIKTQLTALEARVLQGSDQQCATTVCPICYEPPQFRTLTPCCRNTFCLACLCECISGQPVCPMCRSRITSVQDLIVVGEEKENEKENEQDPTIVESPSKGSKGEALLKILSDGCSGNNSNRFLVFSAHEASFKGLRDILAARGIRCELLAGPSSRVDRLRKQFRDGDVRVLCMNARHVGAGINLEAASHIVLYHRMNVELERQVIGRAVRFERADELKVLHLVHEEETALIPDSTPFDVVEHV